MDLDACSVVEQRFLEATMAYQAGKPIVSDEEYDQLKRQLRNKNSMVVQQVRSPCCCQSLSWACSSQIDSNPNGSFDYSIRAPNGI